MRVSGLAPVEGIYGLENIDVTKLVNGHMAYRAAMPRLLREVGWQVESDEFTEIEDPDPENHEKRQRELIRELDDARREAEAKPEKKRFGFFKKGKMAEKKRWETYDDSMRKDDDWGTGSSENGRNVLFDIEAIKAELQSEQIEVKQLESTLPPMKLNIEERSKTPHADLRETKSYDGNHASAQEGQRCPQAEDRGLTETRSSTSYGHTNPFDQGYDEYNLSAEALSHPGSAPQSKPSCDSSLFSTSPRHSFHSPPRSPHFPPPPAEDTFTRQRSPLRSPLTVESNSNKDGLEHNAWADETEDPDFGVEREVKLTF